jgi:hypothetical protein
LASGIAIFEGEIGMGVSVVKEKEEGKQERVY